MCQHHQVSEKTDTRNLVLFVEKPKRFVIRLVDRDLIRQGKRRNYWGLAKAFPTPYETVLIVSLCINLNIALKRKVGVFPILYNCGFLDVLWVTNDVAQGDLCDLLETWGVKRLEVPL